MDKKTYTALMAKINAGEKISRKQYEELVAFAKAKKLKKPSEDAIKVPAKRGKAKAEPTTCSVDDCNSNSRSWGLCIKHGAQQYRKDPEKMEAARAASRRYAAKRRKEKALLAELEAGLEAKQVS